MASNFKKWFIAAAAVASLGLAGCSTIEASLTKSDYDSPIVNVSGNIPGNTLGEIYDTMITAGSTNSEKVLNTILYKLSVSRFGGYYDDGTAAGLRDLAETGTDDEILAFAAQHSEAYEVKVDGVLNTTKTIAKVKDFAAHIETAIFKKMWEIVKNSSYQERNFFFEEKFYNTQKAALYDIEVEDSYVFTEAQILGEKTFEDVEEYFTDIDVYRDFIERSYLPDIYRNLLVENYIINNSYGAIGRSFARNVQIIGLANVDDENLATQKLVKAYAALVIAQEDSSLTITEDHLDFNYLDQLYKGTIAVDSDEVATAIYTRAGFTKIAADATVGTPAYYLETTYGKLLDDYRKVSTSRLTSGSSTDFTNSGAYPMKTGLQLKTRDIEASTHTHQGWYTSSSLSDLSSTFKDRLFKVMVANEVDVLNETATGTYKGTFGWYVNNSYYLIPETTQTTDKYPYCLYDSSSSTWYLVRVNEAVKAAKLVEGGDSSYDKMENHPATLNQIVLDTVTLISDSSSYKSAANAHFIKNAALAYHDQAIYDYFKSTFPDLFE
ncbi:MAG: hypothetical protein K6F32_06755 [Bacilli bacterium]|nr:hypothetical protein [Bacilli bacterium]